MIESITTNGHRITLYSPNSQHVFDIDSISLLIGKNGSGKTEALKSIIKKSKNLASASFDDTCTLSFSHNKRPDNLDYTWGTIYYTPVQHRPKFRSTQNFIDASNRKAKNIFHLYEHQEIIKDFDIKPKIKASLLVEAKKIGLLLTDALIENDDFRGTNSQIDTSRLEKARDLRNKASSFSDSKSNPEDTVTTQELFNKERKNISDTIIKSLENENSSLQVLSTFAVITYLVNEKSSSIRLIIEFLIRTLTTDIFNSFNTGSTSNRLAKAVNQKNEIIRIITSLKYPLTRISSRKYECDIDPIIDRSLFEKNITSDIFNLDWPEMSSGQWSLFSQMINIYEAVSKLAKDQKNILILIDEGDAFLHLEWQRNYIYQMNRFLAKLKSEHNLRSVQLIISTHSPLLASDIPQEFVCQMEGVFKKNRTPTFAAPLQLILNTSFKAKTIGALATEKINQTIHNIKSGAMSRGDGYIIDAIDDPVIKREINRYKQEAEQP